MNIEMVCKMVRRDPRLADLPRMRCAVLKGNGEKGGICLDPDTGSSRAPYVWVDTFGNIRFGIGNYEASGALKLLVAVFREHSGLPIGDNWCVALRRLTEQEERELALAALARD